MYDLLYRGGLTPRVAAGRAQAALVERLLDREAAWHGSVDGRSLVDLGCGTAADAGLGVTSDGLAADFPDWQIDPREAFEPGGRGPLRRARFRVFRLTREA